MPLIKLLSFAAFVGSIIWYFAAPDYAPTISIITSLAALITALLTKGRRGQRQEQQKQVVSQGGLGIQAGGNVTIGSTKINHGQKDAQ